MLVACRGESLHHVSAQNVARTSPSPPAASPEPPSMEVATNIATTATAPDAPAQPDQPMPDAPAPASAHQDVTAPVDEGAVAVPDAAIVPALGDAVSFPQPAVFNNNAIDSGVDLAAGFMPMDFPQPAPVASDERLTAFARLRFDDGSYYMHTYQIMLGRNLDLAHKDMRRLAKVDQLNTEGNAQAAERLLRRGKGFKRHGARSVISEQGGIVSASIESMPIEYQQRRLSNASHSLSAASHVNQDSAEEKRRAPQDMIMRAFPEVPNRIDGHIPEDPYECPLVPIHPQHVTDRSGAFGPKGISREHAKIFYDYEQGYFCVQVLGTNGLRHEGNFLAKSEIAPLDHGDRLQIGAVNIQFYLPDIALTEDQRHRQDSGSRPMSFSFENGHGELETDEQVSSESEGKQSVNPKHVFFHPVSDDVESDDADIDDDLDDYEEPVLRSKQRASLKLNLKVSKAPLTTKVKDSKKANKRKHREVTPEEPPVKKHKSKQKETIREAAKEPKPMKQPKERKDEKENKEQVETKEKASKAPAKMPAKTPAKEESVEATPKETPTKDKSEVTALTDSPPLLRKLHEGELEAGEVEGLITEEMAVLHNLPATLIGQVVEKRKGPGRPPKDGIMSKRQRSQLIKQAKEIEKAKAAGIDPADIPMLPMKPKPPKRKDSNAVEGEDGDIRETTENGDGFGGQKFAKPMKPPRTPSPEMRESDYTEEQLQRPSANYVVLIHEAISASSTGQMNLQQIYNYIEKKYPWYKFKTTTSGWQSSVRHNLGQHDAFVKGDKEGKGFNWKINLEVSIEKERRKRQVSPPASHTQRPPYYPPQNSYPAYPPQPGYPYHPGVPPHAMSPAAPRLPPSLANAQPRLPPSMARESNVAAPTAPQATTHASPYASPWAGGNTAGSPGAANPPRPYPQPNAQAPPASAPGSSGQYGVLYPTSGQQSQGGPNATPSPYSGPYGNSGASPYGPAPSRPYAPYPQQPGQAGLVPYPQPQPPQRPPPQNRSNNRDSLENVPPGRYLPTTHPDLIRQLEAFRKVYLQTRIEPGEEQKVDNAIRAYIDETFPASSLSDGERALLTAISGIQGLQQYRHKKWVAEQQVVPPPPPPTVSAGTAAAIAADQAASTAPPQSMTPATAQLQALPPATPAPAVSSLPPSHRPSVEPLTPVPGSPAVQNGTPVKRAFTELTVGATEGGQESKKESPKQKVEQSKQVEKPDALKAVEEALIATKNEEDSKMRGEATTKTE